MATNTPNMNLSLPTINVDSGLTWENAVNNNATLIDSHNHSPGYGVQITPTGININSALSFNNNPLTNLNSAVFTAQSSLATLRAVYVSGADLYYNDANSNVIQITSGGAVNATSSGISSGTATASFVSSVLVVNAASNTPANVQCGSVLLGNNSSGSKFLTLSPPGSMAANFSLTLPNQPAANNTFLTISTSGTISSNVVVDGSTLTISSNTLEVASGGITGTQVASNINLPGKAVQENGHNVVVSNTNATNSLAIIRGNANSLTGTVSAGEGFTVSHNSTGNCTINFSTAFGDTPSVNITTIGNALITQISSISSSSCTIQLIFSNGSAADSSFCMIAVGQRA